MKTQERQITFELIDSKLIEAVNNSIKYHLVDDMCRNSPVMWNWDDTLGILFDFVKKEIVGIDRAREIVAGLYGNEYKPLDSHGYFDKYVELCKLGREMVIEKCGLHPSSDGYFLYKESDEKRDEMRSVAGGIAEGLEICFEKKN